MAADEERTGVCFQLSGKPDTPVYILSMERPFKYNAINTKYGTRFTYERDSLNELVSELKRQGYVKVKVQLVE
jgi:hypothetical protein